MSSSSPIPIHTSLTSLYTSLGTSLNHASQWQSLITQFTTRFGGRKPQFVARAPGRVNIIGEHIDYCLFGVLPTAVEQDILMACAPRNEEEEGSVHAENLNDKYASQRFVPVRREAEGGKKEWYLDINTKELCWESYVKAGYYGVLNRYFDPNTTTEKPVPVDMLVTGTVPSGSGLSSSAAMVVASTLVFLAVNGKLDQVTKHGLVKLAVDNEKRVGVNSGGMDQAASVTSTPSSALYISFFSPSSPTSTSLSVSPIPLPPAHTLLIANSLVVSDKALTAKWNYNLRVVETLVGARILARHLGVKLRDDEGGKERVRLRQVLGRWVGEDPNAGEEMSVGELEKALERVLPELECLKPANTTEDGEMGVSKEEMIAKTGLSDEEFEEVYLSWVEVEATHFQLYKRALHVFTEALRVLQFRAACLSAASPSPTSPTSPSSSPSPSPPSPSPGAEAPGAWPKQTINRLANLMNASQKSCQELCQSSCEEVDLLVRVCREGGAVGSRITGAGWGGCTVSLVPEALVPSFIEYVSEHYPPFKEMKDKGMKDELGEAIFATKPSAGAFVYKFEE